MAEHDRTTEFIFFHLDSTIQPEDPNNQKGQEVLKILHGVKSHDACEWAGWGRTEENPNALILVLEWSHRSVNLSTNSLQALAKAEPPIIRLKTRLERPLSSVGGLLASPCVDVTTLPFVGSSTLEDRIKDLKAVSRMRQCVTQEVLPEVRPDYYILSTAGSFAELDSDKSPTGRVEICMAVVGWRSRQQHYDMWKEQSFKDMIPDLRERMSPYPPGLGITHTAFQLL
ncbi:hypothetical protein PV08_00010 [Exophiala spinifera]|uniref:ABM domain-containing protein n=1 Tax=Exophiala spinifera TaxID=91928 RepID=A0A0D2BKI1_9EURO|nr:uncharacterized protein PV08_00010 [Exophiala spinifera]KIW19438.1 hypothetical protein PV08_00010 [Exophiala spinifera]